MKSAINQLVDDSTTFVVTTHARPDGDAVGSQLALALYLGRLGKEVLMINTDAPARNLEWIPGTENIVLFDGGLSQRERIQSADVIAVVDTNVEDRLGPLGAPIRHAPARKVVIDHHPDGETWFDHRLVRESASSTGELIFELISERDLGLIDHDLATALYVAIMTDTGSFRYSNVSAEVHRRVADVIELGGIDAEAIHRRLYDTRSLGAVRLLSAALGTISLRHDGRLGYMTIPKTMLSETGADRDDTEGLVNYILSIESVDVAVLFYETEAGTKVSFRAKGNVDVHLWAQLFGGGGHRKASGAFVSSGLDEAIDRVLEVSSRFLGDAGVDAGSDKLSREDREYLSLLANKEKD